MDMVADIIRVANGVLLSMAALASLGVMRFYYEVSRTHRKQGKRHLLPLHVWTISLSYVLVGFAAVFPVNSVLRQGVALVGLAIGVYALSVIFKDTYLRYHD